MTKRRTYTTTWTKLIRRLTLEVGDLVTGAFVGFDVSGEVVGDLVSGTGVGSLVATAAAVGFEVGSADGGGVASVGFGVGSATGAFEGFGVGSGSGAFEGGGVGSGVLPFFCNGCIKIIHECELMMMS